MSHDRNPIFFYSKIGGHKKAGQIEDKNKISTFIVQSASSVHNKWLGLQKALIYSNKYL